MGVYVNEDMPKDCYTCFCYETEFNMCSLTGKRLGNIRIRQDDCPLIEIDTDDPELSAFFEQLFPLLAELQRGSQVYDRSTRRKENR